MCIWLVVLLNGRSTSMLSEFCLWLKSPREPQAPPPSDCHTALLATALGRSPLDERLADRRDLYVTTHKASRAVLRILG
jgi:hypothetical protein